MNEFTENDDITNVLLENMEKKVLSLLYFTASWCGPCQKIKPFLKELSESLKNSGEYNIEFYMIDIDSNEEFCDKCNIRSVPTFFIMNGKDLLGSLSGADKTKLSEMIVNVFNEYNKKLKITIMKNKDIKE
jgi:thioredoxin 1